MPVYPNLKLIYIRIPKTAGEYFQAYIDNYDTPLSNIHVHATLPDINVPNLHEYTIVTLIRKPYDWFESLYNYTKFHKGFEDSWDDKIEDLIDSIHNRSLNSWAIPKIQSEYITLNNEIKVDHIFLYENLDSFKEWIRNYIANKFKITPIQLNKVPINTQSKSQFITNISNTDILLKLDNILSNDLILYKQLKGP